MPLFSTKLYKVHIFYFSCGALPLSPYKTILRGEYRTAVYYCVRALVCVSASGCSLKVLLVLPGFAMWHQQQVKELLSQLVFWRHRDNNRRLEGLEPATAAEDEAGNNDPPSCNLTQRQSMLEFRTPFMFPQTQRGQ